MSTGRLSWFAVLVAVLLPGGARSASEEGLICDDATLNQAMRQYRDPSWAETFAWINPFLPEATGNVAEEVTASSFAATDESQSADQRMAQIVAQYDRRMLDRGGWENPYLPKAGAGNALFAVAVGDGVTQPAAPDEEGAAAGEPDEQPLPTAK